MHGMKPCFSNHVFLRLNLVMLLIFSFGWLTAQHSIEIGSWIVPLPTLDGSGPDDSHGEHQDETMISNSLHVLDVFTGILRYPVKMKITNLAPVVRPLLPPPESATTA